VKTVRSRIILTFFLVMATYAPATTIIFPVEAIDDLWQLPADEFRQKYAGINISGIGPSDEGWYVRYRHENLTHLFGPLADSESARKKKWEMEAVRDAAIRNRASLAASKVDYVKFTYSGVYGKGGGGEAGAGNARTSNVGKSGPDGDLDGDGIPNATDPDMDGDGIPNEQDPDSDGDGITNEKDDYMFGTRPDAGRKDGLTKEGSGEGRASGAQDGKGGKNGPMAGLDGRGGDGVGGDQTGGQGGKMGAKGGQTAGIGGASDGSGQQGGAQKVASAQSGKSGSAGAQGGQSGQSGQTGGQSGSQGSSSGQQGQGGSPGGPPGGGQGGGSPLQLIGALLKAILGL
jgi:hypothetical protein